MLVITILAYYISALAIITYLYLAVVGDAHPFNVVNVFGWPVFVASMAVHAYPAAILNLFFTLVGTIGVLQDRRTRKLNAEATYAETLQELAMVGQDDNPLFTADHPTISVPWLGGQNGKN